VLSGWSAARWGHVWNVERSFYRQSVTLAWRRLVSMNVYNYHQFLQRLGS